VEVRLTPAVSYVVTLPRKSECAAVHLYSQVISSQSDTETFNYSKHPQWMLIPGLSMQINVQCQLEMFMHALSCDCYVHCSVLSHAMFIRLICTTSLLQSHAVCLLTGLVDTSLPSRQLLLYSRLNIFHAAYIHRSLFPAEGLLVSSSLNIQRSETQLNCREKVYT